LIFFSKLSNEQRTLGDAVIIFSVKYKDSFGMSNYLAESFLSFSEIAEIAEDAENKQQIRLTLNKPKESGKKLWKVSKIYFVKFQLKFSENEILKVLKHREEKQAQDFLKKQQQKMLELKVKPTFLKNNKLYRSLRR
jgi:hypothetical protein